MPSSIKKSLITLTCIALCASGVSAVGFTGDFSQAGGAVFDKVNNDYATSITVDTSTAGGPYIYVVGLSTSASIYEYFVIRYDQSGVMQSSATFRKEQYSSYTDLPQVTLDSAQNVYLIGYTSHPGTGYDPIIVKYDKFLNFLSSTSYTGVFDEKIFGAGIDVGTNSIFIVGDNNAGTGIIWKYNSGLVMLSSTTFSFGGDMDCGIDACPYNGTLYVEALHGNIGDPANWQMITMRYYFNLAFQSSATYHTGFSDFPRGIAVSSGSVYVTGNSNNEIFTIKYSTGLVAQTSSYLTFPGGSGNGIAIDQSGNVYVAGQFFNGGYNDYITAKYTPNLVLQSTAVYAYTYDDAANAVAVGISSYVYVTGQSYNGSDYDARTIRYAMPSSDSIPPAAVTDLAGQPGALAGQVRLTWSAPGDDGWVGQLGPGSGFAIFVTTNPADYFSAINPWVMISTSGVNPHSAQSYVVTGLIEGATYYLKVGTQDSALNVSPLSTSATMWAQTNIGVTVTADNMAGLGMGRSIVRDASGNLFIAYQKNYTGQGHIFVTMSSDNGNTWTDVNGGNPIDNPVTAYNQNAPCLVIDSSNTLHCVWSGSDAGYTTTSQIKYSRSTSANGASWSSWVNITGDNNYWQADPTLAVNSKNALFCLWEGGGSDSPQTQIRYSSSTSGGAMWSTPVNIQPALIGYNQDHPTLMIDGSDNLHCIWGGQEPPGYYADQVKYSVLYATAPGWSAWADISQQLGSTSQYNPTAVIDSSGIIHCVWQQYDSGTGVNQIKYSYSAIGSGSWAGLQGIQPIGNTAQYGPSLTIDSANTLYCLWAGTDTSSSIEQIKLSKNSGSGWSAWVNLTRGSFGQGNPVTRWSGWRLNRGNLNIAWGDSYAPMTNRIRMFTDYSVVMSTGYDSSVPAAVTNLAGTQGPWVGSVRLAWSAPGLHGWSGTLGTGSMFGLFYSTNPSDNTMALNPKVIIATGPVNAGSAQAYVIGGLDPGTTYYFWERTQDQFGNAAPSLSNTTTAWATVPLQGTDTLTLYNGGSDGWMSVYTSQGGNSDMGRAVAVDGSGNVYAAGNFYNGANDDIYVRKYSSQGTVLWTRYYNSAGNEADRALGIAADFTGNVYVGGYTGRNDIGQNDNMFLRKYDTSGNVMWTDTYNSPANSVDRINAVKMSSSGDVYAVGYELRTDLGQDDNVWIRKYSSSGYVMWSASYTSPGSNSDIAYDVSEYGMDLFVAGCTYVAGDGYDTWIARLNANTGLFLWTTSYNLAGGSNYDLANSISAGNMELAVTGKALTPGQDYNIFVAMFDYSGMLTDSVTVNGAGNNYDSGNAVYFQNNGVYVAGTENVSGGADSRMWLREYGNDGLIQWTTTYMSPSNGANDAYGMSVIPSSSIYVIGAANGGAEGDNICLRKYMLTYPNGTPNGFTQLSKGTTFIDWGWLDNSTNESGYRVKDLGSVYNPVTLSASGNLAPNTTHWLQAGLTPNTSYTTYSEAFTFWSSSQSSTYAAYTYANQPANTRVIFRSSDTIIIKWDAGNNPPYTKYGIVSSADNFTVSTNTLVGFANNLTTTTYTDSFLTQKTTHYYKVLAYNEEGTPTSYDIVAGTMTTDPISPASPILYAYTGTGEGQIRLDWSSPGDDNMTNALPIGSQFRVQYSTDPAYPWSQYGAQVVVSTNGIAPATPVGYGIKGLQAGATYFIKLWYADDVPNWSPLGQSATAYASAPVLEHVWTGDGSDYLASNPDNWDAGAVPSPFDSVKFQNNSKSCTWDLSIEVSSISVYSPYGGTIAVNVPLKFWEMYLFSGKFAVNSASITMRSDFNSNSGGIFEAGTSTFVVTGDMDHYLSLPQGTTVWSLELNTSSNVYCQNSQLNINGNIALNGVTFETSGSTVNLRGDMTFNTGWEVQQASGKWIIDGARDQYFGPANSNFYDLEINKVNNSTVTLASSLLVTNNLAVERGVLAYNNNFVQVYGNLTVQPSGILGCGAAGTYFTGGKNSLINLPSSQSLGPVGISKNTGSYTVSLASPSIVINSTLTINTGLLDLTDKSLRVFNLDVGANGAMSVTGSTVIFTASDALLLGNATYMFDVLRIDNNPSSITYNFRTDKAITVNKFMVIEPNARYGLFAGSLDIAGGLDIDGAFGLVNGTVTAQGPVKIEATGKLDMINPQVGVLKLHDSIQMNGGAFIALNDIVKSSNTGEYYSFTVNSGTLNVNGLTVSGLDSNGLYIHDGAVITAFNNVSFVNTANAGLPVLSLLQAGSTQYTFNSCSFDSTCIGNVAAMNLVYPGYIAMKNSSGAHSGWSYELDPNNVIFWSTPTAPSGFDGTAMSTDSIKWAWTGVQDTLFYRVHNSTGGQISPDLNTAMLDWTQANLLPNTSHLAYVDAYNPIGVSTASNVMVMYTLTNKPTGVYVFGRSSYSIVMDWLSNGNPEPGTNYEVYYSTYSNFQSSATQAATTSYAILGGLDSYTTYYVRIEAVNWDGNSSGWNTTISTVTLPVFNTPVSAIVNPVNGGSYGPSNPVPVIAGTAFVVAPATITLVQLQILNMDDTTYWTGGAWGGSTWVTATGSSTWTYSAPAWTSNKQYRITSRAVDDYARYEAASSSVAFIYDSTDPAAYIDEPNAPTYMPSALTTASGTAVDNLAGVNHVELRIKRQLDARYWDGATWSVSASTWVIASGGLNWQYALPAFTSGHYAINAMAVDNSGNFQAVFSTATFYITGPASRLVEVLPGQTLVEGAAPGKTGAPIAHVAGAAFTLAVYAMDDNYYIDHTTDSYVTITPADIWSTAPAPLPLSLGSMSFNFTPITSTMSFLTASANGLTPDTTGAFVIPASPTKLQLLVPGESALRGSPTGKNGTPTPRIAGVPFTATINLTDAYWNVSTGTPNVGMACSDPYAYIPSSHTLVLGTTVFVPTLFTAGSTILIAQDASGTGYASNMSPSITVNANSATRLQVLVPGETSEPGKPPYYGVAGGGKTGTPANQAILSSFNITVNAVDDWWNLQASSTPTVMILTTDPADTDGGTAQLAFGSNTFPVNFATSGSWFISATDIDSILYSSTATAVNAIDTTPPAAISDLTAYRGPGHGTVRLTWTAPGDNGMTGNISGGKLWIRWSNGGQIADFNNPPASWGEVLITTNTTASSAQSTIIGGLVPWTTYYFAARVSDGISTGTWSTAGVNAAAYSLAQDTAVPFIINNIPGGDNTWRSSNPGNIYDVDFQENDSVLAGGEYAVYDAPALGGTQLVAWTAIPGVSGNLFVNNWGVSFNPLVEGSTNYVSVRLYDLAGNSATYYDVFHIWKDTTPPSTPGLVTPADGATTPSSQNFIWGICSDNSSGMSLYQLQVAADPAFGSVYIDQTSASNSKTASGLVDGPNWWRIRAQDAAGNYGSWSSTRAINVVGSAPTAPSALIGTVLSTGSIHWEWTDNSVNDTEMRLYSTVDVLISTLPAHTTYYMESNLSPNAFTGRHIRAYNSNGNSSASNDVALFTLANPVTGLTVSAKDAYSITLAWTPGAGGNTRYFVERSKDGVTYATRADWNSVVSAASFTDTGLISDTTYFYRVAGYNGDGIITAVTGPLAAKTDYVPPQVISGVVTQADGTPVTGVEITAAKQSSSLLYRVYTSTAGDYVVTLEKSAADGLYTVKAAWTANDIISSVYKEDIPNGTDALNFTLEVNYVLATITGQVVIARSTQAQAKRASMGLNWNSPAFVELLLNGRVIAKVNTNSDGKYSIPNLLPGKYSVRAFNGLAYSQASIVDVKEGDNIDVAFNYDLLNPDKVYAYPNPAADADHVSLHFETSGQDIDAEINIFTISGELVRTAGTGQLKVTDNVYEYTWNLKNAEDRNVASGVYIFSVKVRDRANGARAQITRKFAVVR